MRFSNPDGIDALPLRHVWRMLREPRQPWPVQVAVTPRRPPPLAEAGEVQVTFVGHSTFLIQSSAGNLLTDPMYSERASPLSFLGPRRVRAPAVPFEDLPDIATVLLSHNHYDHCDVATLRALHRRFAPAFVTTLGNGRRLRSLGIARVEELEWWQEARSAAVPVTATPAQHFSGRGPFDRNRSLWAGFVMRFGTGTVYFAGDSGYGAHFGEIGRRLGPFDLSLLPIGAYAPRWFMRTVHMNPAEAVQAHLDLGSRRSVGMHFGTFQLTTEGIGEPVEELAAARAGRQLAEPEFSVLDFGESTSLRSIRGGGQRPWLSPACGAR